MTLIKHLIEVFLEYGVSNLFGNWSMVEILRMLRNFFLIIINGYSFILLIIIFIYIVTWIRKKNWPILILLLTFLVPFFLTTKFWHGGLYGRYGSFVAFGFALLIGLIPNKKIYWLTISLIIITFLPTFVAYQIKPIPLIQKEIIQQAKITKDDLLILSDYQRPQLTFQNSLYINGNDQLTKTIKDKINAALKNNQKVFITQQAITFPYRQYDGQQIHIISNGDINKAELKIFLQEKKLIKIIEEKNYPLLSIYQIK